MKRSLALAFALLMLLSACSLNKPVDTDPALNTQDAPAQNEVPVQSDAPAQNEVPVQSDTPAKDDAPAGPSTDGSEKPDDSSISEPSESVPEEKPDITISHTDVTLSYAGESFTLSGRNVPGIYACTFTSEDPAVAEVDETTGLVTAAAPGTTTIQVHIECQEGQFDFACIVRCAWKTDETGGNTPRPSLSGFFADLQSSYEGLDAMMVLDGELLENYYPGLSGIRSVEEILVQETMISISNMAIGLVKLSEDASLEDVIAVQDILQKRISDQAAGGAYYPESCETWEAGAIASVSNCVGMFVYPEKAQEMADAFVAAFSQ